MAEFVATHIQDIPVVAAAVADVSFTIAQTLYTFLRIILSERDVWIKVVYSYICSLYSLFTVVLKLQVICFTIASLPG